MTLEKTHLQSTGHNENILTVKSEVETLLAVGTVWFLRDTHTVILFEGTLHVYGKFLEGWRIIISVASSIGHYFFVNKSIRVCIPNGVNIQARIKAMSFWCCRTRRVAMTWVSPICVSSSAASLATNECPWTCPEKTALVQKGLDKILHKQSSVVKRLLYKGRGRVYRNKSWLRSLSLIPQW